MDAFYLRTALALAQSRRGFCAPNPAVGAVVVRDGKVLGQASHFAAGHPHAEVAALDGLTPDLTRGSTIYITLEPCCHFGRTPPCTDLLLEKGIGRVVYGFRDPNPKVSGGGQAALEKAGVEVLNLPLKEIEAFYESYAHWTRTRLPFVVAKLAISLDGKTAGPGGKPLALTGEESRLFTHTQRLHSDAILTTAKTVLADNPRLNARLDSDVSKRIFILDAYGRTPPNARVLQGISPTLFVSIEAPAERRARLQEAGAQIVEAPLRKDGRFDLSQILAAVGEQGIHDLWVEAGATLFGALAAERLLQKAYLLIAPVTVGLNGLPAFGAENPFAQAQIGWTARGRDVLAEVVW